MLKLSPIELMNKRLHLEQALELATSRADIFPKDILATAKSYFKFLEGK